MDNEWKPVVDSFKAANAAVRHVLSDRNIHLPYIVVPKADIAQLFREPGNDPGHGLHRALLWQPLWRRHAPSATEG
jgi:hypothetical protein